MMTFQLNFRETRQFSDLNKSAFGTSPFKKDLFILFRNLNPKQFFSGFLSEAHGGKPSPLPPDWVYKDSTRSKGKLFFLVKYPDT